MIHRDTMRRWRRDASAWFRAWYWHGRCLLTERLFWLLFGKKRIGRAHHMADLEAKIERQREELHEMNIVSKVRKDQVDAANLIISCYGCDSGFMGDFSGVTEETVCEVERTASRLRRWWDLHKYHMGEKRDDLDTEPQDG